MSSSLPSSSSAVCDICKVDQEQLSADGEGSQVICIHLDTSSNVTDNAISDDNNTVVASIEMSLSSSPSSPISLLPSSSSSRKNKFLIREEYYQKADDKMKGRIAPIQKWIELVVGDVYRVSQIHDIVVNIKGKEQLSHYAEFEDAQQSMIKVWLMQIIYEELNNYKLEIGKA